MKILDRSKTKAPSCLYRLTRWASTREEIEFAIRQLDKYHGPWMLKQELGLVAVFVPGHAQDDDSEDAEA